MFCSTLATALGVVDVTVWDSSGKEDYSEIAPFSFRGAEGLVVTYDITSEASFNGVLVKWGKRIKRFGAVGTPVVLVGLKADIEQQREVSEEQGFDMADRVAALLGGIDVPFFETSAKTGQNVEECFAEIVLQICKFKGKDIGGRSGQGRRRAKPVKSAAKYATTTESGSR